MDSENYVVIQGWMCNELSLKGNDLLVYALIFGFSQDGQSEFKGSRSYIAETFNISLPTVDKTLKNLVDKELIFKRTEHHLGIDFNYYRINKNLQGVKKLYGGGKETLHYNNIDNNIDNSNKVLSKDNTSEFDFGGCLESKPKNSLYKKCLALIDDFTDLPEIRKALIEFLNYRLEIKDKPFYVNQFKGMLKALDKAVEETYKYNKDVTYVDVIEYSIQRGWLNFYPIPEKQPYSKQSTPDSNKAKQQKFDVVSDKTATNNDGTQMIF